MVKKAGKILSAAGSVIHVLFERIHVMSERLTFQCSYFIYRNPLMNHAKLSKTESRFNKADSAVFPWNRCDLNVYTASGSIGIFMHS